MGRLCHARRQGDSVTKQVRTRAKAAEAPRSRRARAVADLLPAAGGAAFRRFGFVQSSIVSRWREIVGARYAAVSSPESIRFPAGKKSRGVLTLVVEGAHAPLLQHVAPTIIERVNAFFGYPAIERIVFRQGIVEAARAKARRAPPSLRPIGENGPPLPAELGDSLRAVADDELRACLESLARGLSQGDGSAAEALPSVTSIPVVGRIGGEKKK
ncbi:MAG: DUF721 domain-containing protein [Sphingomonadaceae bacterium]|nr:DUF721 domain-containing protein [Sphingomonadaceae bacterium]